MWSNVIQNAPGRKFDVYGLNKTRRANPPAGAMLAFYDKPGNV